MATNVELQTFDQQEMVGICGRNDEFLRIVRSAFDCTLVARGNSITVEQAGGAVPATTAAVAGALVPVSSRLASDHP